MANIDHETLESPLEIAFHNIQPSASLEAEIRRRMRKLEKIYGRMVRARVSIEALHRQHRTGNVHEVHIEMSAPGRSIVVSHAPHHVTERHRKPTVRASIHDAFKVAEAKLKSFKNKRVTAPLADGAPFLGRIDELHPEEDYGFLTTNEGTQLYFHRNSLIRGSFEQLKEGDSVDFVEALGDTGPTASKVWVTQTPK